MMRLAILTRLSACLGLFVVVSGTLMAAQEPEAVQSQDSNARYQDYETQLFMRAKLVASQKVMEGLLTENFELIRDGAIQMKNISEAVHWPKTIDEVYQHYSFSFRRECDKLVEQAEHRDLRAAHYTHLHMSTTCIDCHNYVRGRFVVKRKNPGGPMQLIPTRWDRSGNQLGSPQPDDEVTD